jgi:ribonucleotide reductase alpha subunit
MSKGVFQFDMWGVDQSELMWDWDSLKTLVKEHGICNSLFTAQMPVASSAKITGSYEMTEVIPSNLFNRRVVGGEFLIANKYLIEDFEDLGIWSEAFKNEIIMNEGSIQNINFNKFLDPADKHYEKKIKRIEHLIQKYRTIWEVSQKELIDMAADRAPFIDQSQSMNVYFQAPTVQKLSSSHFWAWKRGLKSLCYYVRTKAISTGAKHLAINVSATETPVVSATPKPEPIQVQEVSKPENSQFDCFGCSA